MSVYVGTIEYPFGRMIMFHLIADTVPELHEMVDKIGVQRKWFQNKKEHGLPHYDICKAKKVLAIKNGAIEMSDRDILKKCAVNYPDSIIYKLQQKWAADDLNKSNPQL